MKTVGTESLLSFPNRQHFTHIVTSSIWGNEAQAVQLHQERNTGNVCLAFPDVSHVPSPFAVLLCILALQ